MSEGCARYLSIATVETCPPAALLPVLARSFRLSAPAAWQPGGREEPGARSGRSSIGPAVPVLTVSTQQRHQRHIGRRLCSHDGYIEAIPDGVLGGDGSSGRIIRAWRPVRGP